MAVAAEISPRTTDFELWETELEQPPETRKSFDPLASARMLRYDLANFGQVLPETRERVMNEELSYLVEGIGRAARTTFVLRRQESELKLFDRGQWRSYSGMLMTGLKIAKDEALKDPRRQFLAERAREDLQHAYQMQGLQPGQQYVWYSAYPHQEAARYGEAFIKNCGFVPERKMGFLYRASCNEDGDIVLESQTLDRSDGEAFEAAMGAAEHDAMADMDTLVRTYDGTLAKKHGERFYAGRRGAEMENNAWQELRQQHDLIEYFLDKLEVLAAAKLPEHELERNIKKHIYGVWAAFKRRLDTKAAAPDVVWKNNMPVGHWAMLEQEVSQAFNQFAREGRVLVGCGGSVSMLGGEENVLNAEGKDVFDAIFGGKNTSETYKFDKRMYCVVCQAPPKESEPKKMCGPCGICKKCDAGLKRKSAK
jgi:hypothetical protein